ncbi:hypothetical protein JVU11DRAFT_9637 [Chiua virens]|nr:hypothetical protein JVU11DRAFT_9637 [Chiua virens]
MPSSRDSPSDPGYEEFHLTIDSNAPTVTPAPTPAPVATPTSTGTGGMSDPAEADPESENSELMTMPPSATTVPAPASASPAPTGGPSGDPMTLALASAVPTGPPSGNPNDLGCEEHEPEPTTTVPSGTSTPTLMPWHRFKFCPGVDAHVKCTRFLLGQCKHPGHDRHHAGDGPKCYLERSSQFDGNRIVRVRLHDYL